MVRLLALALSAALAVGCDASTPVSPATESIVTARDRAQGGIVTAISIEDAALLAALAASLARLRVQPTAHCHNGTEKTIVATPDGRLETLDIFYKASCEERFLHATLRTLQFVPNRVVIAASYQTWTMGGVPASHGKTISTTVFSKHGSTSILRGAESIGSGGFSVMRFGLACNEGATGICGFGVVTNASLLGISLGFTATARGLFGKNGGRGPVTVDTYAGKIGALTITQGSGSNWIVHGGSTESKQTGTYHLSAVTSALVAAGRVSLTDATQTSTVITQNTRTGLKAPTFAIDATGNGNIRYANGLMEPITGFVIGV